MTFGALKSAARFHGAFSQTVFVVTAIAASLSCAPVKNTAKNNTKTNGENAAPDSPSEGGNMKSAMQSSNDEVSGRRVDLYIIRSRTANAPIIPDVDKLPCGLFKQGPEFAIPPINGGPPIALRGPVQNYYSGAWLGETEYTFKLSVFKRIYHDAGIPDWSLTAPDKLREQYVAKLFDVTIAGPFKATCVATGKAVN